MKKLILIVIGVLILSIKVNAGSLTTSINGISNITAGTKFDITFNVNSSDNLLGIVGKLNYDSSKLTIVSSSGSSGFNLTLGSNLVVDNATGRSGGFSFAIITFKATSNFNVGESTIISLTNVVASNGTDDISGSGSAITINMRSTNNNLSSLMVNGKPVNNFDSSKTTYSMTVNNDVKTANIVATSADSRSTISGVGNKNLNVYSNTFYITVTSESGSKKTYKITILRKDSNGLTVAPSDNNNLGNLTIEGYNIDFNSNNTNYEIEVENNIDKIVINATSTDAKASVAIDKSDNLVVGTNTINIVVTAENGNQKTYTLTVKRKKDGPTTTIGEFLNIVDNVLTENINIDIKDTNTILTEAILTSIKAKKKTITITKYDDDKMLYKWEIDGKKITNNKAIDTLISFSPKNMEALAKLTNYADNFYLHFAHDGSLPENTIITINVSDKYEDGDKVKVYYYDQDKKRITKVYDDIKVTDGFIKFTLKHASDYILSMSEYTKIGSNNSVFYIVVIIVLSGAVSFLTVKYLAMKKINIQVQ